MSEDNANNIKQLKSYIREFHEQQFSLEPHPIENIREQESIQWQIGSDLLVLVEKGCAEEIKHILTAINRYRGTAKFLLDLMETLSAKKPQSFTTARVISVRPEDSSLIRQNLQKFKTELLRKIDDYGGVTKLAQATHLSQPSLSKMFNSDAVPRAKTLRTVFDELGIVSLDLSKE